MRYNVLLLEIQKEKLTPAELYSIQTKMNQFRKQLIQDKIEFLEGVETLTSITEAFSLPFARKELEKFSLI